MVSESGLVPHSAGHAEAPDVVHQCGAPGQAGLGCRHGKERRRLRHERCRPPSMAGEVGAAQVTEVGDGLQRVVELVLAQSGAGSRLDGEQAFEGVVGQLLEQRSRIGRHRVDHRRVEVGAAPRARHLHGGVDAGGALEELAGLGDVRDAGRQGKTLARQVAGHTLAVPSGVGLLDAGPDVGAELQTIRQHAGGRAVVGHLVEHAAPAGRHEGRGLADPLEGRAAGPGAPEHEDHGRESGQVELEGVGSEVDVVPEEGG